jgi:hypothetical protein
MGKIGQFMQKHPMLAQFAQQAISAGINMATKGLQGAGQPPGGQGQAQKPGGKHPHLAEMFKDMFQQQA